MGHFINVLTILNYYSYILFKAAPIRPWWVFIIAFITISSSSSSESSSFFSYSSCLLYLFERRESLISPSSFSLAALSPWLRWLCWSRRNFDDRIPTACSMFSSSLAQRRAALAKLFACERVRTPLDSRTSSARRRSCCYLKLLLSSLLLLSLFSPWLMMSLLLLLSRRRSFSSPALAAWILIPSV